MPTKKPRFMVTVPNALLEQIDNYRFDNRCRSQTEAINQLIERGLDRLESDLLDKKEPAEIDELSEKETEFINLFGALTPPNRRLLLGIAELLLREQEASVDPPD